VCLLRMLCVYCEEDVKVSSVHSLGASYAYRPYPSYLITHPHPFSPSLHPSMQDALTPPTIDTDASMVVNAITKNLEATTPDIPATTTITGTTGTSTANLDPITTTDPLHRADKTLSLAANNGGSGQGPPASSTGPRLFKADFATLMVSARRAYNKATDFNGHITAVRSGLMGAWGFTKFQIGIIGAALKGKMHDAKAACTKHLVWPTRWSDKTIKLFRINTPASDLVSYKLPISFAPMGYLAPSIDSLNIPMFLGFAKTATVYFNNKTMCAPTDILDTGFGGASIALATSDSAPAMCLRVDLTPLLVTGVAWTLGMAVAVEAILMLLILSVLLVLLKRNPVCQPEHVTPGLRLISQDERYEILADPEMRDFDWKSVKVMPSTLSPENICDFFSQPLDALLVDLRDFTPEMMLEYIEALLDFADRARAGERFVADDGSALDPLEISKSLSAVGFFAECSLKFLVTRVRTQSPANLLRAGDCLSDITSHLLVLGGEYVKLGLLLRTVHVAHDVLMEGAVTIGHLRTLESHCRDSLTAFEDPADHEVFIPLLIWTQTVKGMLMIDASRQFLASAVTGKEVLEEVVRGAQATLKNACSFV